MTTTFDPDRLVWVCTEGCITVRGPSRSGCEERVRELQERLKQAKQERLQEEKNDEQQ